MKAYIIHENDEWTLPLKSELNKLNIPFEDWHVEKSEIDLGKVHSSFSWIIYAFILTEIIIKKPIYFEKVFISSTFP